MAWRYRYEVMRKACGLCGFKTYRIIRFPRRKNRHGVGVGRTIASKVCDCRSPLYYRWDGARSVDVPSGSILVWEEK